MDTLIGGDTAASIRTTAPYNTRSVPMAHPSVEQVEDAFSVLPKRVTGVQIAAATGRTTITNWVQNYPDFPEVVATEGRSEYRERDEVLAWYVSKPLSRSNRRGPRDVTAAALAARPSELFLTAAVIGNTLGITRRAVYKYNDHYGADSADPFPEPNDDGRRSWSAVRAWLLRHKDALPQPGPDGERDWPLVQAWLLRHHTPKSQITDGVVLDELGVTWGQRDVIERARLARAAGVTIDAEWLASELELEGPEQVDLLLDGQSLRPPAESRMDIPALASALDITVETVKRFISSRTAETSDDPFPAADDLGSRDVHEVEAWFRRNRVGPYRPKAPAPRRAQARRAAQREAAQREAEAAGQA
ncbi:hypothetical protein PV726_32400 [Streptomyces europaeiscabiei]|uniref:hypothetical protein n=1 Tax=Streptomyces europaeiscabiei TaxID=146819 RepID=UPI0029B8569D|nr:hypothetical protein [Streptomyces europaeiscabiei]MDX3694959.1 hypothetical protein [Streptomyces europaeiscabiei]